MKIFINILKLFFAISIAVPFFYTAFVYSTYESIFTDAIIDFGSLALLIVTTILLTAFDSSPKMKYNYIVLGFSMVALFFLIYPWLTQFSGYLFIKRNENKLTEVISEMKARDIAGVYSKNKSDEFKKISQILNELEINDVQITSDGSILFMEGGFMEVNGWCYSETGVNPKSYFLNANITDSSKYGNITYWSHSFGNWYRWAAR